MQHGVKEFRKRKDGSGKLGSVVVEDLVSGAREDQHPAGVFVFIGLDPNTGFVQGTGSTLDADKLDGLDSTDFVR